MIRLWRAYQRWLDIMILWPSYRDRVENPDHARAAFRFRTRFSPAWSHLSDTEIDAIVERLT